MGIFRNDENDATQDDERGRGESDSPAAAAARYCRLPAHGGSAVRRAEHARFKHSNTRCRTSANCCSARNARRVKTSPSPDDIYEIGTLGSIIQLLRLPDGTVKVLVEGKSRAQINRFVADDPYFSCEVEAADTNLKTRRSNSTRWFAPCTPRSKNTSSRIRRFRPRRSTP